MYTKKDIDKLTKMASLDTSDHIGMFYLVVNWLVFVYLKDVVTEPLFACKLINVFMWISGIIAITSVVFEVFIPQLILKHALKQYNKSNNKNKE